ncbi:MAG: S1/P1 Nuclease [Pedobacter sp.]|nr:MAG: S1/P1 Nuclease [Pedobacter sp.]
MFKKIIFSAAAVLVGLSLISWGVVGHRAIGKIAQNHLSTKAAKEVKTLLGSESLAMVSTYADEIRPYKQYAYTAPWHYVNVAHGLSRDQFVQTLTSQEKPNIYKAVNNCVADLKDPSKSKSDKVFALKFLVHLVGDLHQPMHTGRSEDSGGNAIKIKLMRRESNLHGLWDSGLIDYAGMSYQELAKSCDTISKTEIKKWQADDVAQWIYESYEMSQQLYAEAEKNPEFDYDYYPKHADFMKKRLAQAGIRLAGLLNQIYQ